jgi:hypothetical protein
LEKKFVLTLQLLKTKKKMRFVFFVLIIVLFACNRNGNSGGTEFKNTDSINGPVLYVKNVSVDLGTIIQGERKKCTFSIENRGKSDLIIRSVSAGCGCTSTDWDPAPIKPRKKSVIDVEFNSGGRTGKQVKKVYVNSNAQEQDVVLTFTCEIVLPNKSE